jgi:hypothetical protein
VRVLGNGWYGSGAGGTDTPGMTGSGYGVSTGDYKNGDLLLLIGNVDNGTDGEILVPGPSWTTIYDTFYGGGTDGQTYFAAWAVASNETAMLNGSYADTAKGHNGTMTLLDITGANTSNPIGSASTTTSTEYDPSPTVQLTTAGMEMTTTDNTLVILAGGVDWESTEGGSGLIPEYGGSAQLLSVLTDEGSNATVVKYTNQVVEYILQSTAGFLGDNHVTMAISSNEMGAPWTMVLVIEPAQP